MKHLFTVSCLWPALFFHLLTSWLSKIFGRLTVLSGYPVSVRILWEEVSVSGLACKFSGQVMCHNEKAHVPIKCALYVTTQQLHTYLKPDFLNLWEYQPIQKGFSVWNKSEYENQFHQLSCNTCIHCYIWEFYFKIESVSEHKVEKN